MALAALFLEEIRMRAGAHEEDSGSIEMIDKQEIPADMTFPMVGPVTFAGMIAPFRAGGCVVCDEQQHHLF